MQNQHTSLALPPLAIYGALQPDRLIELLHILFWNMTVYGQARNANMLTNVLSSIKPLIVKVQKISFGDTLSERYIFATILDTTDEASTYNNVKI